MNKPAQLVHRARFDLADPFLGDAELVADRLQRLRTLARGQPVAASEDSAFSFVELAENPFNGAVSPALRKLVLKRIATQVRGQFEGRVLARQEPIAAQ